MDRKEAIETIRRCCPRVGDSQCDFETSLRELIPELAESEDERIRKEIISIVKAYRENCIDEGTHRFDDCLSWLEKQKEQIPYIDFVIKPHKGDDNNPYDMRVSEAQEYAIKRGFGIPFNDGEVYVDERHLTQTIGNILRWADEHPKEQKPADISSLRDWKFIVDAVLTEHEGIGQYLDKPETEQIAKKLQERFSLPQSKPAEWSEADEKILKELIQYMKDYPTNLPNGHYSRADFFAWLEKLKTYAAIPDELVKIYKDFCEQGGREAMLVINAITGLNKKESPDIKPHWKPSEDEERLINTAISFLKDFADKGYENAVECIDWLKSKLNGDSGK